ncbi:hypothetical protein ACVGWK_18340 [Enterobacter sichuanensis]
MQERQDTGSHAAFTGASSNNQLVGAANPLVNGTLLYKSPSPPEYN